VTGLPVNNRPRVEKVFFDQLMGSV